MAEEAGFKLDGEFYPWVDHYDIPTTIAVEYVTGIPFSEFAEMLDESGDEPSVTVMAGMMAAGIAQKYPGRSPRQIKRLLGFDLASDNLEIVRAEAVEQEAQVVQLPLGEDGASSAPSSPTSTAEPTPPDSDEMPPNASGVST